MTNGNRRVTVGFVVGQTQGDSSWLQIGHVASTLNLACMKRGQFSGSKTTTATNSRISIIISHMRSKGTGNRTLHEDASELTARELE